MTEEQQMEEYEVLSPDGFDIRFNNTWLGREAAREALLKWIERYEAQGYYSSNGERIPLNEIESRCTIQPIKL